jgi:hypothetical protein
VHPGVSFICLDLKDQFHPKKLKYNSNKGNLHTSFNYSMSNNCIWKTASKWCLPRVRSRSGQAGDRKSAWRPYANEWLEVKPAFLSLASYPNLYQGCHWCTNTSPISSKE